MMQFELPKLITLESMLQLNVFNDAYSVQVVLMHLHIMRNRTDLETQKQLHLNKRCILFERVVETVAVNATFCRHLCVWFISQCDGVLFGAVWHVTEMHFYGKKSSEKQMLN